jgi:SNF2 family DNA or RNA helicase
MTTLLPHQQQIREKLLSTWIDHPHQGFVVAAAVGMGKTIASLMSLLEMYSIRGHPFRVLIVVPTVVIDQWKTEWTTKLNLPASMIHDYHGPTRVMKTNAMITLTTHGILQSEYRQNTGVIFSTDWDILMIDEAHLLGNGQIDDLSRRPLYEVIYKQIQRDFTILLTATPYTNAKHNIYSLLSLINVEELSEFKDYSIQMTHKDMNIPNMFPKTSYHLQLIDHQNSAVRSLVGLNMSRYRKISNKIREYRQRNTPVPMALLASLQSVTTKLRFLDGVGVCSKAETESIDVSDIVKIPKIQWILSHLAQIQARPDPIRRRVVVVSEFTSILEMIQRVLDVRNISNALYTGNTGRLQRKEIQESFVQATDLCVLLLSKSAGGIGLSLEAGNMILYEPHFNYAKDAQTIGRVQRLGQTHAVDVHFLCMEDGIDKKLRKIQLQKVHESRRFNPEYKIIIGNVFPGEDYHELSDDDSEDESPWRERTMEMMNYDLEYASDEDDDYVLPSNEPKIVRRRITKKSQTISA